MELLMQESIRRLPAIARARAVELTQVLMEQGYEQSHALRIACSRAWSWYLQQTSRYSGSIEPGGPSP